MIEWIPSTRARSEGPLCRGSNWSFEHCFDRSGMAKPCDINLRWVTDFGMQFELRWVQFKGIFFSYQYNRMINSDVSRFPMLLFSRSLPRCSVEKMASSGFPRWLSKNRIWAERASSSIFLITMGRRIKNPEKIASTFLSPNEEKNNRDDDLQCEI